MDAATEPDLERSLRRARRVIRGFRLIFYPGAAILAFLLLTGSGGGDRSVWIDGPTSQNATAEVRLDGGRPARLNMDLRMRCPAGESWTRWLFRGPFTTHGDTITVTDTTAHRYRFHDQTSSRTVTLEAHVRDGTLSGTATVVEHFDGPYWGRYTCESEPVTFSAD